MAKKKATIRRTGIIGDPAGKPLELTDGRKRDDQLREKELERQGSSVLPLGDEDEDEDEDEI